MKNVIAVVIALMVLIGLLSSCRHGDVENSFNNTARLQLADSIRHIKLAEADSIYRIVLNNQTASEKDRASALFGLALIFIDKSSFDSAGSALEQAKSLPGVQHDSALLLQYYLTEGYLKMEQEEFGNAESNLRSGLSLAEHAKDVKMLHTFRINLAQVMINQGKYAEAIQILNNEIRTAENQKNLRELATALGTRANAAYYTNDIHEAVSYTFSAMAVFNQLNLTREYAGQLVNLGIYYKILGQNDSAMIHYGKAQELMAKLGDSSEIIRIKFNIANILKKQHRFQEAENEMHQIFKFCKSKGIPTGQIYALTTLSAIYSDKGLLDRSLATIDSAIKLALENQFINDIGRLYESRHTTLAEKGNFQEAYKSLFESQKISDSLLSIEKQKEILKLKTRFESEKKEAENVILRKTNEAQSSKLRFSMLVILLGGLIFVLIIIVFILRHKRLAQLRQLEIERNIRLEQEKKAKEIELEKIELENNVQQQELARIGVESQLKETTIVKLELQARIKEQELVFHSLARTELVQILQSLEKKMSPFRMKLNRKKDQEEFDMLINEISRTSNVDPLAEFELLFSQLHPEFHEKLLSECPALSKKELLTSAFIRLNLSSKDIARLNNLSLTTVENIRYHIRLKLNLDPKTSLTTYLMTI